MRLGIVTTVYNHAHFLPECIRSVDGQTAPADAVHVVVNDASPDNTWEVIRGYSCGISVERIGVNLSHNLGLAGAFHRGVAALPDSVEWILKVDADDKIDPRYVEEILRAADEDPTRNVIFAPCKHFGNRCDVFYYPKFDPKRMQTTFMIPGPAAYKRTLWDAVGGYDVTMRSAEDWDFYIRAQLAVGLNPYQINIPGLFWHYRVHGGPRASSEGMSRLHELRAYWKGHTRNTALAKSRSWGAWCRMRGVAA